MKEGYKELEILVAKIQQQLAPQAEVLHNVKLPGRESKTKRQIDVLVREQVGQYQISIVIECKDYSRPVDVKGVEEFNGLLRDVGAQKGVMVCPKGFTESAKKRAAGLQIDLYSPVDTDPHKWQASATIPAIFDFREVQFAFRVMFSAPAPLLMKQNFYEVETVYDLAKDPVGTPMEIIQKKWSDGELPIVEGTHEGICVLDEPTVLMDNGYGQLLPFHMTVDIKVTKRLYFGQLPIARISGFKDEFSGKVITNAFECGFISPEEVENDWHPIQSEDEASVRPVIKLRGLLSYIVT